MSKRPLHRIGLIVNPYAGTGGPLALKGSDTLANQGLASRRTHARTVRALGPIAEQTASANIEILAAPGTLGADAARDAGLVVRELDHVLSVGRSTPADTTRCATLAREAGVDLLLFTGGDGTARDVLAGTGTDTPILGVPGGVKMHSGVFAATPEQAGRITLEHLLAPGLARFDMADVVDSDEEKRRAGLLSTQLYGAARIPQSRGRVLPVKAGTRRGDDHRLRAACKLVAAALGSEETHLLGPGSTMARVMESRGLHGSLLGVDAVRQGEIIGRDLTESQLLRLVAGPGRTRLILGVIGGQGMLLGRGNQQLSSAVLRRLGIDQITVLASRDKLLSLDGSRLHVDTGDAALDADLCGWLPVTVGPGERLMMEVVA